MSSAKKPNRKNHTNQFGDYLKNEPFQTPLLKPFPKNFVWGVATSSYQVEGATRAGGRADSIWDYYARIPGRVYAGENGDVAVDQYHRYKEDIALMKDLGITHYRFSVSWARVIPAGKLGSHGKVNARGLDYYKRLVDELLRQGMKPALTLYHWDHPQVLEGEGGWTNRAMAYYFADYAEVVSTALQDRVNFWITLNEPWCSSILSYLLGVHAPGLKNRKLAYDTIHHLNLAHGLAVGRIRNAVNQSRKHQIGIACNFSTPAPASTAPVDIEAADRAADRDTRMFLNPLLGKPYPERHLRAWKIDMPIKPGDDKIMSIPIDFMGINYYKEDVASREPNKAKSPEQFLVADRKGVDTSDMGWPVVPEGLYRLLRFVHKEVRSAHKKPLPLYVTENGYASPDEVVAGRVHDYRRIAYLSEHLKACQQALQEGMPVKGYFVWSFIDNYEWTFGYQKRFGIVHCNFRTLRRIPKDSYYFYQGVIKSSR